jgi:hypothetical protein
MPTRSRQASRAEARKAQKLSDSGKRRRDAARRKIAWMTRFRAEYSPRTPFERTVVVLELAFLILGGPLIWWLYTPSWERKSPHRPSSIRSAKVGGHRAASRQARS